MSASWRAGIIAAGDGSRLRASHPDRPKPMVEVKGKPLIHWVASSLRGAGAAEITVLLNSRGSAARTCLSAGFPGVSWRFLQEDTKSSWESFRLVAQALAKDASGPFLISAVDTIASPGDVEFFAGGAIGSLAKPGGAGACLALTRYVDDEKPLWADLSADGLIRALGPDAREKKLATSGLYAVHPSLTGTPLWNRPFGSLREFLTGLVRAGDPPVRGVALSRTVDVDRPEDLGAAEALLDGAEAPR